MLLKAEKDNNILEQNKNKNKKVIIVALVVALVLGVGATIAYFTTSATFENIFKSGKYGMTAEEIFKSPEGWLPGDETEKEVTVENTGNVDMAVRIWYEEYWENANGQEIPSEDCSIKKEDTDTGTCKVVSGYGTKDGITADLECTNVDIKLVVLRLAMAMITENII